MKFSEQTLTKVLVNLKCCGYMGRATRRFSTKERGEILSILEKRGLIDEKGQPTLKAMPIITANLNLCDNH